MRPCARLAPIVAVVAAVCILTGCDGGGKGEVTSDGTPKWQDDAKKSDPNRSETGEK